MKISDPSSFCCVPVLDAPEPFPGSGTHYSPRLLCSQPCNEKTRSSTLIVLTDQNVLTRTATSSASGNQPAGRRGWSMGAVNLDQSIKHSPLPVAWREQFCPLQNWGFLTGPSLKTRLLKGEGRLRKEASSRLWCFQPMKSI